MNAQHVSGNLVCIKDVQRTVAVIGKEVGHIDKERNRAQPDGPQCILQPDGRRAVFHATDHATVKHRALIQRVFVDGNADRAREHALDRRRVAFFQCAQTTGRQITRNTAHAQRIGAVGGNRDLDHRIDLGRIIFGKPVDEAITDIARWQLDDAVMLFGQFQLALGGHHAKAFDATDFADTNRRVDARHIDARLGNNHRDPFAGIGGTANNLLNALVGLYLTDAQTVGIRVLLG